MCLSIELDRPECILKKGQHAGYDYVIAHNGMGYRCGYVRVPNGHPWHSRDSDEIECDVHGGLTFAEADIPCNAHDSDDGYWFGFDCAHGWDAPDPELPGAASWMCFSILAHPKAYSNIWNNGTIRTTEYIEAECQSLCRQAAQMQSGFATIKEQG